jgi:hypothetical protein
MCERWVKDRLDPVIIYIRPRWRVEEPDVLEDSLPRRSLSNYLKTLVLSILLQPPPIEGKLPHEVHNATVFLR